MKCNECSYKEVVDGVSLKCLITGEARTAEAECDCESTRVCRENKAKVAEALDAAEDTRNALRNRAGVIIVPKSEFAVIYNSLRNLVPNPDSVKLNELVERMGKLL